MMTLFLIANHVDVLKSFYFLLKLKRLMFFNIQTSVHLYIHTTFITFPITGLLIFSDSTKHQVRLNK